MLSRFRMTVDDCITEFKNLGREVFGRPRAFLAGGILSTKFDGKKLDDFINGVSDRHCFTPLGTNFNSDPDFCRT
jgi:hypothetical protein